MLAGLRASLTVSSVRGPLISGLFVNTVVFAVIFALPIWGIIWLVRDVHAAPPEVGIGFIDAAIRWLLDNSMPFIESALISAFVFMAPVVFAMVSGIVLPIYRAKIWNAARNWAGGPLVPGRPEGLVVEARLIGVELRRLGRFLFFSLALLFLNLLPYGATLYFVAQFLLTVHTMGWDLMSYHYELHDVRYGEQKSDLVARRRLVLAVGTLGTLLTMIPLVQVLFVSTNAAGAGILSARLDGAQPSTPAT